MAYISFIILSSSLSRPSFCTRNDPFTFLRSVSAAATSLSACLYLSATTYLMLASYISTSLSILDSIQSILSIALLIPLNYPLTLSSSPFCIQSIQLNMQSCITEFASFLLLYSALIILSIPSNYSVTSFIMQLI